MLWMYSLISPFYVKLNPEIGGNCRVIWALGCANDFLCLMAPAAVMAAHSNVQGSR